MKIELRGVAKGRAQDVLPETSTVFATGAATLVVAETEQRPTVLGLVASGRMTVDAGTVTIDGRADARAIRRRVALVDAPIVSEPEPNVTVAGVVAEELMFAGRAPTPFAAQRWLDGIGLGSLAGLPIGNIDAAARIRMLLELAALRAGVEGLVLVSPDRHGGEPSAWWEIARELAERGYAVLVIAGHAARGAVDAYDAERTADAATTTGAADAAANASDADDGAAHAPAVSADATPTATADAATDAEPALHADATHATDADAATTAATEPATTAAAPPVTAPPVTAADADAPPVTDEETR